MNIPISTEGLVVLLILALKEQYNTDNIPGFTFRGFQQTSTYWKVLLDSQKNLFP